MISYKYYSFLTSIFVSKTLKRYNSKKSNALE